MEKRFQERYIDGNVPLGKSSTIGAQTLFNKLPNWKSLSKEDLDKVILNGLNKIIVDHKLECGGYFIISQGTRLVIPVVIAKLEEKPNHKLFIINTVLHTGMSNIDTFHHGSNKYDSEKIYVERTINDFYKNLNEYYTGSLGILEDSEIKDDELGILLEYTVEGEYNVNTNYPLIVVE